ncbi:MAG: phosphoenolpyruvate carboxykinase (ATP) [Clostridiales bacterium]|jgi:phosphoenolpyruvate carboxykinase (ATP)|nr:phosphoenolpyruvate carboxykinase (ATP) [Clostridiales bacterium]
METYGLEKYHIMTPKSVGRNLSSALLTELALRTEPDAKLTDKGALLIETGKYTGRSPKDKFTVDEPSTAKNIDWEGENKRISEETFDRVCGKIAAYLSNRDIYVFDGYAGADPAYRLNVRIVTEYASANLFMQNMLIRPETKDLAGFSEEFTILCAPGLKLDPKAEGLNSEAAILVNFKKMMVIICGSKYCGEMKKSVFSVMNYILPLKGVLGMHCSANVALDGSGDTALFFGLSGTGKTTLSADPNRGLIGDDEHGWSDKGIFNIEGGCYAKCIGLTLEKEPDIYRAIRHGAVVENVVVDPETRVPDYDNDSLTENTRVSYPLDFIDNAVIPSVGGHPKTVVFLTADAFGVLPPVAKLTKEQAMYYFVSGYTSKLAGTERGITDPVSTFSTCFGSPFLPLKSGIYAELLGEKIEKHGSDVYLINTGWTGGAYGVGKRMSLPATRAIVTAALNGELAKVDYETEAFFGLSIPKSCPGVDAAVLNPKNTWSDKKEYDRLAKKLAGDMVQNFKKYKGMSAAIVGAGPKA